GLHRECAEGVQVRRTLASVDAGDCGEPDRRRNGESRRVLRGAGEVKLLLLTIAMALAGTVQASGNAQAGKDKAAKVCAACHGPEGNKPSAPDQPVLAGQYYD